MKWILACDPGIHTGLVLIDPDGIIQDYCTAASIEEVEAFIHRSSNYVFVGQNMRVVVESFAGAGHISHEAIITMRTVGFIEGYCCAKDIEVTFQTPQSRLAFEESAKVFFATHAQRHIRSAYAHALRARHQEQE